MAEEPLKRRAYCAQPAQLCMLSWAQVVGNLRNNLRTMLLFLDAGCWQVFLKEVLPLTSFKKTSPATCIHE